MLKSGQSEQIGETHGTTAFRGRSLAPSDGCATADKAVVTQFLESVSKSLTPMPADKRAEIVRELCLHLNALVEAGMELGEDRASATRAAIAQFGDAKKLASRLRWAWIAPASRMQREILYAAVRAGSLGLLVSLVSIATTVAHVRLCFHNPEAYNAGTYLLSPVMSVFQVAVPIFAGRFAVIRALQSHAAGLRLWISVLLQVAIASILEKIMFDIVWTAAIGSNRFIFTHIVGYFEGLWSYALPAGILAAIFTFQRRRSTSGRSTNAFALFAASGWIAIGMAQTIGVFGAGPFSAIGLGDAARCSLPGLLGLALLVSRCCSTGKDSCEARPISSN